MAEDNNLTGSGESEAVEGEEKAAPEEEESKAAGREDSKPNGQDDSKPSGQEDSKPAGQEDATPIENEEKATPVKEDSKYAGQKEIKPAGQAENEKNPYAVIEELLRKQARHNRTMLFLASVKTVVILAIAAFMVVAALFVVNFINDLATNLEGALGFVDSLSGIGDVIEDLQGFDLTGLNAFIGEIDKLDLESLEENIEMLGDGVRSIQRIVDAFPIF